MATSATEKRLIEFIAADKHDPLRFVRTAYQWGKGELSASTGPRKWQAETLDFIGKHLRNPETRFDPLRIAVASGHGIGKSSLIGMIIHWALSTCVDTKILVTANSEPQLRTKTWPEVSKWFRLGINSHWFKITATSIAAVDKEHDRTWRADALPWTEHNPESFAGLHNQGRRIVVIFDESSNIAEKIWEVVMGALTDENTEIIWVAFGNPTRNSGAFRECFGAKKHRWKTRQIDSRTVEGTNLKQFEEWQKDYGEDSDFFKVRVKGEFPRAGSMQFIPSDLVEAARRREPEAKLYDALVLGCDIARFGDDETVLAPRRGQDAKSIPWVTLRGADTMQVATRIADLHQQYKFDAIFIDEGAMGAGVIDRLRMLKMDNVIAVQFGAAADKSRINEEGAINYANKRAEMYGNIRDWLKHGMIPDDPELAAQLTGVEYGYVMREGRDAILLEKKSDMKKRGLSSPDRADALCFEGDTLISTPIGYKKIKDIKIGDEVVTPFGTTKVAKTWLSFTDKITTAEFSNGASLSGKGEHKIFVWGAGQKRLDALTFTDEISVEGGSRFLWAALKVFSTKDRDLEFKPLVDTISQVGKLTPSVFFIAGCGRIISVISRKIMTFTIKTAIGGITISPIWRSCVCMSIEKCTQQNLSNQEYLNLRPRTLVRAPQNGTGQKQGCNGTENTVRKRGLTEILSKLYAKDAVSSSIRFLKPVLNFVPGNVRKKGVMPVKKLRTKFVYFAELFTKLINTGTQSVVAVGVQTDSVQKTAVYNLTLEKHNAYYANGILVYNCLTLAHPVFPSDHRPAFERVGKSQHITNYNPLDRNYINPVRSVQVNAHQVEYNPFGRK